jgi:hypothetical protein
LVVYSLRFEQVVEVGRRAWRTRKGHPRSLCSPSHVQSDYVYEYGGVWLRELDAAGRTVSMRAIGQAEVPPDEWRHIKECRCPYCES